MQQEIFSVSAVTDDYQSGICSFQYTLNGGGWLDYTNHTPITLKDGDSIMFVATDNVGNMTGKRYDYNAIDYNALKNYDLYHSDSAASDLSEEKDSDILKGMLA